MSNEHKCTSALAGNAQPSTMFHNFNLPHGNDDLIESAGVDEETEPQYINFDRGFSDDDARDPAFDHSFPSPREKSKGSKSPRRSEEDEDDFDQSPQAKKSRLRRFSDFWHQTNEAANPLMKYRHHIPEARVKSIFGGPLNRCDSDGNAGMGDDQQLLKTPGQGIRDRLYSLALNQQQEAAGEDEGNGECSFTTRINLDTLTRVPSDRSSSTPSVRSSLLDEDEPHIPLENPVISHGLRTGIERQPQHATWVDLDQSGDFDPHAEIRKKMAELSKAKTKKALPTSKTKGKGNQKAPAKKKTLKRIVKLPIKAIGNVLNITNAEENWPDGHSLIDTEDEQTEHEFRSFYRCRTPGIEQIPIPDPRGEVEDLTGHPVARGCKSCRAYEQHCSMIDDSKYPCAQCVEEDLVCHAIIEPKVKGRCRRCAEMGKTQTCSLEVNPDAYICDECLDADCFDCVAGPPSEYTVDRIDLNRVMYGPDRKWVTCTSCRINKKKCSLKKQSDKPPCKQCKKNKQNIGCTFYDGMDAESLEGGDGEEEQEVERKVVKRVKPTSKKKLKPAFQKRRARTTSDIAPEVSIPTSNFFTAEDIEDLDCKDENDVIREETPEIEMEDAEGRTGVMTKIQTSFAHPIKFCTSEGESLDCNFCDMPIFGFVGYFERTVHVMKWFNGLGYTELAAGHREEQDGATTMCQNCTFDRLQVMACPNHEVERIDTPDALQDFDLAAEELMLVEPNLPARQYQLQRWCSLCFTLATVKCCTPQPPITSQDDDENQPMLAGCGLRLCDRCEGFLREDFSNSLQEMVLAFEEEPKPRKDDKGSGMGIARADVELLNVDGLLMQNVS